MGIPQYTDEFMCAAYENSSCIRIALWRMDTDKEEISIPFNGKITKAKAIYPLEFEGALEINDMTVKITMPRKNTAAIFEIETEQV